MHRSAHALALFAGLLCASCAAPPPRQDGGEPHRITVRAYWHNQSPSRTAKQVAAPLEKALAKVKGVTRTVTHCDETGCTIVLQHDGMIRSDQVAFDANTAVNRIKKSLPRGAHAVVHTTDLSRPPDLVIGLIINADQVKAEHYPPALDFANGLMRLPAAVRYQVVGMPVKRTIVEFDPVRAQRWENVVKVDTAVLADAIREETLVVDDYTRVVLSHRRDWRGRRGNIADIVLKRVGRTQVRIRDVARVRTVLTPAAVHRVNGEPAILIHLHLRSGALPSEVRACLARILKQRRPEVVKRVVAVSARGR